VHIQGKPMRTLCLLALVTGLSVTAHADDWTGNLLDAVCSEQKEHTVPCDATAETTAFALDVSGTIYKLDPAGNVKAAAALKYRAPSMSDPSKPESTAVKAKITGTEAANTIVVDTISLQ
jgi:hypothetical protein